MLYQPALILGDRMISYEKLRAAENTLNREFVALHPDFAEWWFKHPHYDPGKSWGVSPRVAYNCEIYRKEFFERHTKPAV